MIININNDNDIYDYYQQNHFEIIQNTTKSNSNYQVNNKYVWCYDLTLLNHLITYEALNSFSKLSQIISLKKKGIKKYWSLIHKFYLYELKKKLKFDSLKEFLKENLKFIKYESDNTGNYYYISYKQFESFMKKLIKKYINKKRFMKRNLYTQSPLLYKIDRIHKK